ncbi:MAG: heme peroxidase [Devosia sp.]|uniref:peroxidase family protein n=1 Tax=Devosia sp. TaxID=1871048 RepID=UPI002631B43B|nr:peroxidase family protein [Devosia sp.]MDB5540940.1 heme peroxidase [Devosia sp.]
MPSVRAFNITLSDTNFLLDQLRQTIVVVRYDANGQAVFGYVNSLGATVELGTFGTFDPLAVTDPTNGNALIYDGARDPTGIRILHGFFNNLTGTPGSPAAWKWGSADEPFPRLTPAQYNHYVHQVVSNAALTSTAFANYLAAHPNLPAPQADSTALYADPSTSVVDYTPRMITQTISSSYMQHAAGVADSAFARADIATDTFTETITRADGTTEVVEESVIRNQNTLPGDPSTSGIFTLFGQFFDHGLDFIDKGGQGAKIVIALDPSDPLYRAPGTNGAGDPGNLTITISRATPDGYTFLDIHGRPVSIAGADGEWNTEDDLASIADLGADGVVGGGDDTPTGFQTQPSAANYTNHTSPYIDQSQSYGSDQQVTNLLREWVQDPNTGAWRPGAELFDGHQIKQYTTAAFGTTTRTVPTLSELRAHLAATGRGDADSALTWDDIGNLRARDAAGNVLDTNGTSAGGYVYTGQALLLDMNPHFDNAPLRLTQAHVDALNTAVGLPAGTLHFYGTLAGETVAANMGQLTDGTNIGAFALAPWVNFANFSITAADPAVYDAISTILMDSVGDHYIAGDGRANENFGLTSLHHVFHENHNVQLIEVEANILAQTDAALRHGFQLAVTGSAPTGAGVTVVGGHYEDANGNYTNAAGAVSWDPDKLFEVTKLINEMEYQHVAIDQYARLVTPDLPEFVTYDSSINADITLEYSQAAFRFGHSQLRETIDAIDPNGMVTKFALAGAFLNPAQFAAVGAADILHGMSQQVSNEIDEFLTPAMQQSLLGQALDLGAINIARARDVGLPTLNETRRALHDALVAERATDPSTPHHTNLIVDALNPYTSWADFGSQMLHPESLVNFIAAYAFDGDLAKAEAIIGLDAGTILEGSTEAEGFTYDQAVNFLNDSLASGDPLAAGANAFNDIDLWIGGLAEVHVFTGQVGSTFNAIFEDQMERLMDGDRFYYIYRLGMSGAGALLQDTDLGHTIVTEQFRDLIERTTGVLHLNGDVMGYADSYIELGRSFVPGQNLLAYKGELIHNSAGLEVTANQGDIKYMFDGTAWVPILADFKTAHNYGDQVAAQQIGIYSGPGGATSGNGGVITKSVADLGIVNQQYIRDFRPNLGANDDGTDNQGFDSHEVLSGTDYRDFILAGNGDDTVYGDKGDDMLDGGGGADHLYGGDGQDALYGGDIEDFVDGGAGDDWVYVGSSSGALDVAIGGDGNDRVYGEAGIDEMYGGAGDDYMDAGGDTDIVFGDSGNDQMFGGDGPDELRGGDGDDILSGGSGPDMLKGERGDDIIYGGIGQTAQNGDSDEVLGDIGFDIAAYSDVNLVLDVAADLRNMNLTAAGGATPFNPFNQLLVDVEGIIGSRFDDRIIGADAGTGVDGQPTGDNWLIGGGGNDTFNTTIPDATDSIGSGGNDLIIGDGIRLDTLIGKYDGYTGGFDANGNALHGYTGTLSAGLLGNAALGTQMFAKHYTELLKTERNQNLVLGTDAGTAGAADTAVFTGNRSEYTVERIQFASANEGTVTAFKITHNNNGPDGIDLLLGIEKFQFADGTFTQEGLFDVRPQGVVAFAVTETPSGVSNSANAVRLTGASSLTDPDNVSATNPTGAVTANITYSWLTNANAPISTLTTANPYVDPSGRLVLHTTSGTVVRETAVYTDAAGNPTTVTTDWNMIVGTSGNNNPLNGTTSTTVGDAMFGLSGSDVLNGLAGADRLYGGAGNDTLNGGTGNDYLNGGTGVDIMAGGDGDDLYVVDDTSGTATQRDQINEAATVAGGVDTVTGDLSLTLVNYANVENITLTGTGNSTATGNAGNNVITGNTGNNTLNAGTAGTDTLIGGAGNDIYVVNHAGVTITENTGEGTDTVQTTLAAYSLAALAAVENLAFTGAGAFTGTGNAFNNSITGGTGADILTGAAGNDTIGGAGGSDTAVFAGGIGNFSLAATTGDITVTDTTGADGTDTLTSIEQLRFNGVNYGVVLGTNFNNTTLNGVAGAVGSQAVFGLGGNDTISGGAGDDYINGGAGTDVAAFSGTLANHGFALGAGGLVVSDLRAGNPDGTDILSGIEQIRFGSQTLNLAVGTAGANTLTAGAGSDLMIGFAGNDTFAFGSAGNANNDIIQDLQIGDRIDLSAIDAIQGGANDAFTLVNHTSPGDVGTGLTATGQVSHYLDAASGHYFLAGNTNGDTNPEFRIDLGTTLHTFAPGTDIVL